MAQSDLDNHIYFDGEDTEEYRDELATVTKSGKRIWIYPKKPGGRYYNYRKIISYILLAILFGLPWIKYNGRPFVLFNILESKFIVFGTYFAPQDSYLLVIAMLIAIIFVVLFTVIFRAGVLRMDMPADYFYGNGIQADRVPD